MATIYEIKRQADELAAKTNINSISPSEVGGLIRVLADYAGQVETDGGTLGIRKIYASVAEMEADENPIGFDGKPLKRGNLVAISDGTDTGKENNRIYVYRKPEWTLMGKVDAGYATRIEMEELEGRNVVMTEQEYEELVEKDADKFYFIYEKE